MTALILVVLDLIAIGAMLTLYFLRHRRRDLVVAFLVINVGVLAVTAVLADSAVGIGLGLGLFGVLSIIRLRSSEIAQHEVAYYFAALTIGLVAGFPTDQLWASVSLMALVIGAIAVGDLRGLLANYRQQVVVLDRPYPDESALRAELERMLGARVMRLNVRKLDLVSGVTIVDVRFRLPSSALTATEAQLARADLEGAAS